MPARYDQDTKDDHGRKPPLAAAPAGPFRRMAVMYAAAGLLSSAIAR